MAILTVALGGNTGKAWAFQRIFPAISPDFREPSLYLWAGIAAPSSKSYRPFKQIHTTLQANPKHLLTLIGAGCTLVLDTGSTPTQSPEDTTMNTIRTPFRSTKMHLTAAERSIVVGALGRAGTYQRGYLRGHYSVSGADLTGLARKYGGKYRTSRESVHAACQRVGIELVEVRGYRGARSVWSADALLALWTAGGK